MTPHSTQDYQGFRLHDTGRNPGFAPGMVTGSKPQIIGIWRLVHKIHEGSWCDIFAAQPADAAGSPRFDYAVKIARGTSPDQPEVARQLHAEVNVSRVVRHPHLVPILDGDLQGPKPFFVMPRLAAQTLAQLIAKSEKTKIYQPIPVALWWTRQTAQALSAVHQSGWVHGDVKPDNILVDPRGHVTLIDLGFAQPIGATGDQSFRGTPDYAAPERLSGALANPQSDIFSLGEVLARLLPSSVGKSCPETVTKIVEAMRATAAEHRPTTQELCDQLLKLEIETLHLHISPEDIFPKRVA